MTFASQPPDACLHVDIQIHDQSESIKLGFQIPQLSLPSSPLCFPAAPPPGAMCRSIHAFNASRHIPREACPRLSKLEAGRPIIFQGLPFARIPKDPSHYSTTRPRPRIMNSLHPLISSLPASMPKSSWLLARRWERLVMRACRSCP